MKQPSNNQAHVESLPAPIDQAAFYGLAGEFVKTIEPHTESDPIALLLQFLVAFGNVIGRNAYYPVEASRHYMNLFAVMVGQSAKARKGTSLEHVLAAFLAVAKDWADNRRQTGLSSGEGLLYAVRDAIKESQPVKDKGKVIEYQQVIKDPGERDKRLLVTESEFARTLKVMEREGNTLSPLIRDAWDTGKLRVMTKTPQKATDAHISIIGHITRDELRRELTNTEAGNGFANRFLWLYTQRSKLLPDGGAVDPAALEPLYERIKQAVRFASSIGPMQRDEEAREAWHDVYGDLTREEAGMLGAIISRAEAQVLRLSCIYALLDQSSIVRLPHLQAALVLWEYAEQSARYIFGDALGDPVADAIMQALRQNPDGMTRKDISDHFSRHHKAERLTVALMLLQERGLATCERVDTKGRPAQSWKAVLPDEETQA